MALNREAFLRHFLVKPLLEASAGPCSARSALRPALNCSAETTHKRASAGGEYCKSFPFQMIWSEKTSENWVYSCSNRIIVSGSLLIIRIRCENYSTFYLNRQPACFALMYTTHKLEKHSGVSEQMRGCNDGRVYRRETGELPAEEASWARGLCRCVPGRTHLSPDGRGH